MLTAILTVQEELLTVIPNVQLTFLLVICYGATIGILDGTLVVIVHVIIDNLIMNSFTPFIIIPMFMGLEIALIIGYLLRNKKEYIVAIFGGIAGLIYALLFFGSTVLFYNVEPIPYLIADIPFDVVLISCNVIAILFLYKPIINVINHPHDATIPFFTRYNNSIDLDAHGGYEEQLNHLVDGILLMKDKPRKGLLGIFDDFKPETICNHILS